MTISTAVTQNETANRALERWLTDSLWHDDSVNLGNQRGLQPYWLQDALSKQLRQADAIMAPAALEYSVPEGRIFKWEHHPGLIFGYASVDPTAQAAELYGQNVQFSAIHPGECPNITLFASDRNIAAHRELDRNDMAATIQSPNIGLACELGEPRPYAAASLNPINRSLLKAFTAIRPFTSTVYGILSDLPDSPSESSLMSLPWSIEDRELPTTEVSNSAEFMKKLIGSALFVTRNTANVGFAGWDSSPSEELLYNPIMRSFAEGFAGICPSIGTLEIASKIVQVAFGKTSAREIEVDDVDGALAFELRMSDGLLLVGELSIDGNLHANVYNDQHPSANAEINELWVKHLPHASAEDLFDLIR